MMDEQPYNLNQPVHRLLADVKRRIEAQLQDSGIMVTFDSLPAVEDLIDQYNTALTNAWDENNKQWQLLKSLRGDHHEEDAS